MGAAAAAWPRPGQREGVIPAGNTDMAPVTLAQTQPWPLVLNTVAQQSKRRQSTNAQEGCTPQRAAQPLHKRVNTNERKYGQKTAINRLSLPVDKSQSNAGRVTLSFKVTQGRKLNPFKVVLRRSLKTSVIGHTSEEEAGLHNLKVSANPIPYSQKAKWSLTLFLVGWKGSMVFS